LVLFGGLDLDDEAGKMSDDDQFSRDWMAEVNAKAQQAQPPGANAETRNCLGCFAISMAAIPGTLFLIWLLSLCLSWLSPKSAPAPAQPGQVSKAELDAMSLPRKMASINAGYIVPETHPDVAEFASAIAKIRVANPNDSEQKICDLLVATHERVKEKEPDMTLLRLTQEMARFYGK
jgi:hypothetical protein